MSKSRRRKEKREARKAMQEVTWRIRRDMEARETAHVAALADDAAWHKARRPFPPHRSRRMAGK